MAKQSIHKLTITVGWDQSVYLVIQSFTCDTVVYVIYTTSTSFFKSQGLRHHRYPYFSFLNIILIIPNLQHLTILYYIATLFVLSTPMIHFSKLSLHVTVNTHYWSIFIHDVHSRHFSQDILHSQATILFASKHTDIYHDILHMDCTTQRPIQGQCSCHTHQSVV